MIQAVIISNKELSTTPEYLWLRILGRNRTQASAIEEVLFLSRDDPRRSSILQMLFAWKIVVIETNPSLIEFSEVKTMAYPQVLLKQKSVSFPSLNWMTYQKPCLIL